MNSHTSTAQNQLHTIALTACILSGLGFFTTGLTAIPGLYLSVFVHRRLHRHSPRNLRDLSIIGQILGSVAILIYLLPLLGLIISSTFFVLDLSGGHTLLLALLTCLALLVLPILLLKFKDLSQRRLYRRTVAENLNR